MKAIFIDDLCNVAIIEGKQALFLSDGRDDSPMFIECECHHVINADQTRYDKNGIVICPVCDKKHIAT